MRASRSISKVEFIDHRDQSCRADLLRAPQLSPGNLFHRNVRTPERGISLPIEFVKASGLLRKGITGSRLCKAAVIKLTNYKCICLHKGDSSPRRRDSSPRGPGQTQHCPRTSIYSYCGNVCPKRKDFTPQVFFQV